MREGLSAALTLAGMSGVAKAGSAAGLPATLTETAPDVVLVGLPLGPIGRDEQLSAFETIRLQHPGVGVLALSPCLDAALRWR